MRLVTVSLLCLISFTATAQTVGDCVDGQARADLDVGSVQATLFNAGNLFFGGGAGSGVEAAYYVPKELGVSAVYAANFWLGGKVNGELRTAASTYVDFEFWPGPLDENGTPPTDCSVYDRIYSVYRADVKRYLESGELTDDLRDWPVELGAPVLDGDGVEGNYNLEGGDQPAIWGDQTAWWVMNDLGNVHARSQGQPLGIEVQVTAFASASPQPAYNHATYYIYRLVNRNPYSMDSVFASFWRDVDLGTAADDHVGTDTLLNVVYAYNADNDDSANNGGYGFAPPSLGAMLLQGPVVDNNGRDDDDDGVIDEPNEQAGLYSSMRMLNGVSYPVHDPNLSLEFYFTMNGRWLDGDPMTEGGDGHQSGGPTTRIVYPGDPVTDSYWSEVNTDGNGSSTPGGNKRGVLTTGPFTIESGDEQVVAFALVYGRGANHIDSITHMRTAARGIQSAFDDGLFSPSRVEGQVIEPPEGAGSILLSRAYPNPFVDQSTIRYSLPAAMDIRLAVFDVLGREVALLAEGEQPQGEHEATLSGDALRPGAYFVRLEAGNASKTIRLLRR